MRMRIDFARWNHVLIPQSKEARDRFRMGLVGRFFRPVFAIVGSFTREGQLFAVMTLIVAGLGLDVLRTDVYLLCLQHQRLVAPSTRSIA